MATILLLGTNARTNDFAGTLSDEHSIYIWNNDDTRESAAKGVQLESLGDIPCAPDAVIELSCIDDGDQESNLSMISEMIEENTLIYVNTLFTTATAVAALFGGNVPVIGISYIPGVYSSTTVVEAASAMQVSDAEAERAIALLGQITGKSIEHVTDRIGLVSARILAMIVNEAAFALMEGVADPEDIDTAMKLGTNYPEGPLRWADIIGADVILTMLQALYEEYREERYRPCVLLKQYVRAGLLFHTA